MESPMGEWTEIQLICFNGKSLHIVNGEVVMVHENSRYFENEAYVPLIKGKIQLQSEACEVFCKDSMIQEIDKLPTLYAQLF